MNKRKNADGEKGADASCRFTEIEQMRLNDLVDKGTINLNDSAAKVKGSHESFQKFSNSVVGYHLGVLLKFDEPRSNQVGIIPPVNEVLTDLRVVPKNTSSGSTNALCVDLTSGSSELTFENMPFVRYTYMQYDTKQEKLVVLLDLPGGTCDYDWEINEYRDSITVVGSWSKALYDKNNQFQKGLQESRVTLDHPKLHAMQNEVVRQGYSSKNVPMFRIHVDLGKRVQKDDGTWLVDLIQHDGNKILFFEFSGFQEEVLKIEKRGKFT